jgi:nitrous oxidase accessory protein
MPRTLSRVWLRGVWLALAWFGLAWFGLASVGAAALAAVPGPVAAAETLTIAPGGDVAGALSRAAEGDTVRLASGLHRGPLAIVRRLTLEGEPGAVVEGPGTGNVITLSAPGAVVRGLAIRGSGRDQAAMDAGVFVEQSAAGAVVEGNVIEGNLYGVYLHGAPNAVVRDNTIVGIRTGRVNEAGNGVSVWNAPGSSVVGNTISYGRDGIFSISSRANLFRHNTFEHVRFAVHYMYTNDSEISGNVSRLNTVGYAIMFSNKLVVRNNLSDHDRDRGFVFNFANGSEIAGNTVTGAMQPGLRWQTAGQYGDAAAMGVPLEERRPAAAEAAAGARIAPEKCVFLYNSNANRFSGNWFEGCEIGIHFTAGSERNEIFGNAFVRNRTQVKYVGTRHLDWSSGGRGNYWSDNPNFDLNGDGLADMPYRPNDIMDKVLWTTPQAKVLATSPAVHTIRWAQSQFPALLPGGVVDTHPLIAPPPRPPAPGG